MKDKDLILHGNPCSSALSDPDVQTFEDAKRGPIAECPYAADPSQCSPPHFGCVRVEGARMARAVVHSRTEVSERSLLLQRDLFRLKGPLPGTAVEAYIDPEHGFELITEPEEVVQRVWRHACAVLDLKPRERVRSGERYVDAGGTQRAAPSGRGNRPW